MIDFRYHLVSLIAVFLAVALGIVIGTTALNEPILADIENQVADLEQDKRDLEDRTQVLQTQVDTADAFETAVAPALVDGTLAGQTRPARQHQRGRHPRDRRAGDRADRRGRRQRQRRHLAAAGVQRPLHRREPAELRHRRRACPPASSCPRPTTPAS